ncbi:MAG: MerR family transcriptional regulator [Vicingaceae bacterium]
MENTSSKIYYSIGEVSRMFNVNTSLIRFWEKEFSILKPHKNKKGNRLFTKSDVDNLHLIYNLVKERGYTLDGAKKKLKENKDDQLDQAEMLLSLKKIRTFLIDLKTEL